MANKIALWAWHLVAAHILRFIHNIFWLTFCQKKLILALFQTA